MRSRECQVKNRLSVPVTGMLNLIGVGLAAVVLAWGSPAQAQQQPRERDQVGDLRRILNAPLDEEKPAELQQRKDQLTEAVAKLTTLEQLGDALMLSAWHIEDPKRKGVQEIHLASLNQVATRFEAEAGKA